MNSDLRHAYRCNTWNRTEFLLEYLRGKNCFQSFIGEPNANPYWWGSTLGFATLEKTIADLISAKSIKPQRMLDVAVALEGDLNSPIVRLTGMAIQRILKKIK